MKIKFIHVFWLVTVFLCTQLQLCNSIKFIIELEAQVGDFSVKALSLVMNLCVVVLILLFGCEDNNSLVGNTITESEQSNWDNYKFNNHQVEVAELEILKAQVHELIKKTDDLEGENAKKVRHGVDVIQKPDPR